MSNRTGKRVTVNCNMYKRVHDAVKTAGSIRAFADMCGVATSVIFRIINDPYTRISNSSLQGIFKALKDMEAVKQ